MGLRLHRFLWGPAAASAIALAIGARAAGQQSTFSSASRTVAIYATVTDANGALMPDLLSGDFEVYDDGKRQPLTVFGNDIQPITVVMLLDRSGSTLPIFGLVQKAAEAFVTAMSPADKARIGSFSNRIEIDPQTFTSDHDELMRILATDLQDPGPTPLWNAVNVGITALIHEEGRRVILLFTDGGDNPANFRTNNTSLSDVMKRAEEENVMVYAVGVAGGGGMRRGGGGGRGGGGRRGGFGGGFGGRPGNFSTGALEQRGGGFGGYGGGMQGAGGKPDPGLAKIAAATGGGYFELQGSDDLAGTFTRVADELHHQYAMGFTPPKLDGKTHQLDVHVLLSGTTVHARKSYVATKP